MQASSSRDYVLLLTLWLAIAALIGVRGDFPLSDDWAYAHAAQSLCRDGDLDLLPWTGASLLFQAGYGAVLCKVFGLSFEVLRISTLALAALGIVACRALLLAAGATTLWASFGAFVLLGSPVWVNLSFTFMTDIPFAVFAILAVWGYERSLHGSGAMGLANIGFAIAGSAHAAAALLIRQHGLFVALAGAIPTLLDRSRPWRSRILGAAACLALPAAAGLAYVAFLWSQEARPEAVNIKLREVVGVSPLRVLDAAYRGIVTVGTMLIPVALALPLPRPGREALAAVACAAPLTLVGIWLYWQQGDLMPYLINVLHASGIGALSLRDVFFLGLPHLGSLPAMLRTALTLAGILAVARLAAWEFDRIASRQRAGSAVAGWALALLFASSLLQTRYYFDRYLIVLLPLGIAALSLPRSAPPLRAWIGAALIAVVSVAGTHDYLAWNRARWQLLTGLEARGISASSIDGGMEYNAWRLAAQLRTWPSNEQARPRYEPEQRSWWWVVDDEYVIAFGPLPGYEAFQSQSYSAWLPGHPGQMLVLRRVAR